MINITIVCHSDGLFSVGKNLGGGHGSRIYKTRAEADAAAKKLQDDNGGPDKATIIVHDLTKSPDGRI